ncbi:Late secretory pathway protein AVL9, partial [Grifola frondosa]
LSAVGPPAILLSTTCRSLFFALNFLVACAFHHVHFDRTYRSSHTDELIGSRDVFGHFAPASPRNSRLLGVPEPDDDELSDQHFSDGDTASQRSIALSSPPHSPRTSVVLSAHPLSDEPSPSAVTPVTLVRQGLSSLGPSKRDTVSTDVSSDIDVDADGDDRSFFRQRLDEGESPISSVAPSVHEPEPEPEKVVATPPPLPPSVSLSSRPSSTAFRLKSDTESVASFGSASTSASVRYSRKARPESLLVQPQIGPLVLGIALVDFNHLVGPKIEFSRGSIFEDEEIVKILPFLALPDGAHLVSLLYLPIEVFGSQRLPDDRGYSYFHLVPTSPNPTTVFGISCNRQISTSSLLVKDPDVTRSTVQKAVVILASKPVFGPIRDRLGVITRTLFAQRDFSETSILEDFYSSLEHSLRGQLTESGLYMGTSLRELVHTFRQRTLVLLKALMLQKKIMFFGHPVERLCTYQYSLVTLVPGLLQNLDDCGSPPLAARAQTLSRPTSLRTSDPKSMMAYVGLPLDLFGKDAFFQPYLPLQQLDMLKDTSCLLCGSTNSIVTQQKEVDLLVNIETGTLEFKDPRLERSAGLTAADRKWMDDIVRDVNEGYDEDPNRSLSMLFKGSDDYLRQKFEEYITGALASVKYAAFLSRGQDRGVMITDGSGDPNSIQDFNPLWIQEFKKTNAYEVWDRVTDPLLFDLIEARHPCSEKPSVVADIGLRLSEGIQELKLEQQLAPTREAISRTITAGSTNFFKAVEGVRGRWLQRNSSSTSDLSGDGNASTSTVEVSKSDARSIAETPRKGSVELTRSVQPEPTPPQRPKGIRPLSIVMNQQLPPPVEPVKAALSSWGAGIGSFFSQRTQRMSTQSTVSASPPRNSLPPAPVTPPSPPPASNKENNNASSTQTHVNVGQRELEQELQPRNLDEVFSHEQDEDDHPAGTGMAL